MNLLKYYIVMMVDILSIIHFYSVLGYTYNNFLYNLLLDSLILLIGLKIILIIISYIINNYTKIFSNKYFFMLFQIYIIMIIYNLINNLWK